MFFNFYLTLHLFRVRNKAHVFIVLCVFSHLKLIFSFKKIYLYTVMVFRTFSRGEFRRIYKFRGKNPNSAKKRNLLTRILPKGVPTSRYTKGVINRLIHYVRPEITFLFSPTSFS